MSRLKLKKIVKVQRERSSSGKEKGLRASVSRSREESVRRLRSEEGDSSLTRSRNQSSGRSTRPRIRDRDQMEISRPGRIRNIVSNTCGYETPSNSGELAPRGVNSMQ